MESFIVKNGRKLRRGYTTGSCAAAAAKCAVQALFTGNAPETVSIDTPAGFEAVFKPFDVIIRDGYAECSVVKDAGDDPDVTDGIKIYARAEQSDGNRILVKGGAGIGIVTIKGLCVKPGKAAINPVPMKMIINEAAKVRPEGKGVTVTVSAPEGLKIAEKTFNPKLGIIGGISILGTTGIVEPLSNEAVKESMTLDISILKDRGEDNAVFVPGKYGRDFTVNTLFIPENRIITTGNYIGYMLHQAAYYGIKNILLTGHIGKLIKLAGGNFDTHSRVSDAKLEIITANYILSGGTRETALKIMNCRTTEEALDYIDIENFYSLICTKIREKCLDHVHRGLNIEVMIFSIGRGLLAQSVGAEALTSRMRIGA